MCKYLGINCHDDACNLSLNISCVCVCVEKEVVVEEMRVREQYDKTLTIVLTQY